MSIWVKGSLPSVPELRIYSKVTTPRHSRWCTSSCHAYYGRLRRLCKENRTSVQTLLTLITTAKQSPSCILPKQNGKGAGTRQMCVCVYIYIYMHTYIHTYVFSLQMGLNRASWDGGKILYNVQNDTQILKHGLEVVRASRAMETKTMLSTKWEIPKIRDPNI